MYRVTIMMCAVVTACAGPRSEQAKVELPVKSHETARPLTKKLSAPIALTLESDQKSGRVAVHLKAVATAPCPGAHYQFKLPTGIRIAEGQLSETYGMLQTGQAMDATIVIEVPPDKPALIAAGVTCRPGPHASLVKSAILRLGAVVKNGIPTTRQIKVKGTGVTLDVAPAAHYEGTP